MTEAKPLDVSTLNPALNPTIVKDAEGLALLRAFLSKVDVVGFDCETNIVKKLWDRKIRTIQIGNKEEQYIIDLLAFAGDRIQEQGDFTTPDWFAPVADVLSDRFIGSSIKKVGHNLSFDYQVLRWCLGLSIWNLHDTMLCEQVLYAGSVHFKVEGFWALDDLVARYCKLVIDKSLQKSFDLESPLTEDQITYCALDTRLPLAIMTAQCAAAKRLNLEVAFKIENDALPAFADLNMNGIYLEPQKWLDEEQKVYIRHLDNIAAMDVHFLPIVGPAEAPKHDLVALELDWKTCKDREKRALKRKTFEQARREVKKFEKDKDTYQGKAAINYGSSSQMLNALRSAGFGPKTLPSTDDRYLSKIKGKAIIDAIIKYRETEKYLKTYGRTWVDEKIDPRTGRIHSDFSQMGAATGRTSSSGPNIQNIPKGSDTRACFTAPNPDRVIVTVDYNGCELRILAEMSQEPAWVEAFKNGWDVHSVGAEIIFGAEWTEAAAEGCAYMAKHAKCSCPKHKKLRDHIKAINFGIAYGMEAQKLADDLGISKQEAQKLLDKYRKSFPKVTEFLRKMGEHAKLRLESRTICGRRRLYTPPTWEKAREKAAERAKERGLAHVENTDVSRAYYTMFSSIEREGKNAPIQGTNADMIKLAMGCGQGYLWHELKKFNRAIIVNIVHDELVIECDRSEAELVLATVVECMNRAGKEFIKTIPVESEGHIEDCWSKG